MAYGHLDFSWGWVLGFQDGDLADVILGFVRGVVYGIEDEV